MKKSKCISISKRFTSFKYKQPYRQKSFLTSSYVGRSTFKAISTAFVVDNDSNYVKKNKTSDCH